VDARASGALACMALSALACGYDYVDRQAALDAARPPLAAASPCHAGEPVEGAKSAAAKELLANPGAFAAIAVRVRGTLASDAATGERLVTKEGDLRLDLGTLPPFWMETCPGHVVDVDGILTSAKTAGDAAVLHAVAMIGAP
jgi:hypothetical protein